LNVRPDPAMLDQKRLGIYLNDHLAGSTVGLDLARRALGHNKGNDYGRFLTTLASEIESDRETLKGLMRHLEIGEDQVKKVVGWAGEKLGRLKLNGQLLGYSPLSRLLELEGLCLGVEGKLELWRSLKLIVSEDARLTGFDFDNLIDRAERQREVLERNRLRASEEALTATA
jgi:hypothetical protein